MTNETDSRLNSLEMKLMDQEQIVQDLSDMVNQQWQEIERLKAKLVSAQERLVTLEESLPGQNQPEKPPHY